LGYGDLSSYGHPSQEWNAVDDLTLEGLRLTSMYASASLCSPSRTGLLTGRLFNRVGVFGDGSPVFSPDSKNGLPNYEITVAEALKDLGYTTGFVGKWHQGINGINHTDGSHLPSKHGFDYVGLFLPLDFAWECDDQQVHLTEPDHFECYLYRGDTMVQQPYKQDGPIAETMLQDFKDFVQDANFRNTPFFFYYSLPQPHVALLNTPGFAGSSERGRYGDNIRELGWQVGEAMAEIKRLGIDSNTMVMFTSDNGPHVPVCNEAGITGPLKGAKGQYWEGGIRVPGIVRWPGRVRRGVTSTPMNHLDILPTFVSIAGGQPPSDRILDGRDMSSLLLDLTEPSEPQPGVDVPPESIPENPRLMTWYCGTNLHAVRFGPYKFHYRTQTPNNPENAGEAPGCGEAGFPVDFNSQCMGCFKCVTVHDTPLMYDLEKDPSEAYPLDVDLPNNKAIYDRMIQALYEFESTLELGDPLLNDSDEQYYPCCTPETFPVCACDKGLTSS